MSGVSPKALDGASVRVLDHMLELLGSHEWRRRRTMALSDRVSLVIPTSRTSDNPQRQTGNI